jgi:hypothetical protein
MIDVNSVLGLLHPMVLGNVVDFSEIHAVFVFMVEVFGEFLCKYGVLFRKGMGDDRRGTNSRFIQPFLLIVV